MARVTHQRIVKRMYDGQWQFFAGVNKALGAVRWSSAIEDAARFTDIRLAQVYAHQFNGFVTIAPPKQP